MGDPVRPSPEVVQTTYFQLKLGEQVVFLRRQGRYQVAAPKPAAALEFVYGA